MIPGSSNSIKSLCNETNHHTTAHSKHLKYVTFNLLFNQQEKKRERNTNKIQQLNNPKHYNNGNSF